MELAITAAVSKAVERGWEQAFHSNREMRDNIVAEVMKLPQLSDLLLERTILTNDGRLVEKVSCPNCHGVELRYVECTCGNRPEADKPSVVPCVRCGADTFRLESPRGSAVCPTCKLFISATGRVTELSDGEIPRRSE